MCWIASSCSFRSISSLLCPPCCQGRLICMNWLLCPLASSCVWLMENDGRRSGKENEFEVLSAPGSPLITPYPHGVAIGQLSSSISQRSKVSRSFSSALSTAYPSLAPYALGWYCALVVIPGYCTFLCGLPTPHLPSFCVLIIHYRFSLSYTIWTCQVFLIKIKKKPKQNTDTMRFIPSERKEWESYWASISQDSLYKLVFTQNIEIWGNIWF